MVGIEPTTSFLPRKRSATELHRLYFLSLRSDLNRRPSLYKSVALPLSYSGNMVLGVGFEPTKAVPADLQSAPFDHFGTPAFKDFLLCFRQHQFLLLWFLHSFLKQTLKSNPVFYYSFDWWFLLY